MPKIYTVTDFHNRSFDVTGINFSIQTTQQELEQNYIN